LLDGGGNSSWLVHVQAALQNVPRHRAIHRPGADVRKSKPLRQRAGDATFAGSSRTVDGDDIMGGHEGLRRFFIGNRADASSWSPPVVIPSEVVPVAEFMIRYCRCNTQMLTRHQSNRFLLPRFRIRHPERRRGTSPTVMGSHRLACTNVVHSRGPSSRKHSRFGMTRQQCTIASAWIGQFVKAVTADASQSAGKMPASPTAKMAVLRLRSG